MIKAVIFDYGGVIDLGKTWQDAVKRAPCLAKFDGFLDAINSVKPHWKTARDGNDNAPFWQALSVLIDKPPKDIKDLFIHTAHPEPEMLELASQLREKYKVALLSNHIEDWLEPVIAANDMRSKFDVIVTSYQQRISKPNYKIFEAVLKELDVKPEHAVFIDDFPHNVSAARELGIIGLDFESIEKLKQDLNELEIL